MNGVGRRSLIEVFCTVNYTSCTWYAPLKSSDILQSLSWNPCSLVMKISLVQKITFFGLCWKIFFYVFAWVNLVMFFSLFFICARLWILVYLQFTKYGFVVIWLKVIANKFGKGVFRSAFKVFLDVQERYNISRFFTKTKWCQIFCPTDSGLKLQNQCRRTI